MSNPSAGPVQEILLLHFGKNKRDKWAADAFLPLSLKPQVNIQAGHFKLADDLVTAQPNHLGTTSFFLGQSIVPIVAHVPGEKILRCLGTGFFISCTGLLITATHVITDPIERQYGDVKELDSLTWEASNLKIGVMLPTNPLLQEKGFIFRDIEWATFLGARSESPLPVAGVDLKLTTDTAVCKVAQLAPGIPHQPLAIVQAGMVGTGMTVGKMATALGYGAMRDVELTWEAEKILSGDFFFELHVSAGKILEQFPDNLTEKNVSTPGACFSAELALPAGMSGSPIFDDEGIYVHGVVSKGWEDEHGLANFGYGCMLLQSLGLPISRLGNKSLYELQQGDEHGFPKLQGPGI
jgi:hypothetical protein